MLQFTIWLSISLNRDAIHFDKSFIEDIDVAIMYSVLTVNSCNIGDQYMGSKDFFSTSIETL